MNPVNYSTAATGFFDRFLNDGLKMSSMIANPEAVRLLQECSSSIDVAWLDLSIRRITFLRLLREIQKPFWISSMPSQIWLGRNLCPCQQEWQGFEV